MVLLSVNPLLHSVNNKGRLTWILILKYEENIEKKSYESVDNGRIS